MGRKNADDKKVVEAPKSDEIIKAGDDAEADSPVVTALKAVDDKYLEVERKLEKEVAALRVKYQKDFDPLIAERKQLLDAPSNEPEATAATPSCPGFWFTALKRLPSTTDEIEPHDEAVLESLSDVRASNLDAEDASKGFKVEFEFVENAYFTNKILTVEFQTKEGNPWAQETSCQAMKSTEIDWKAGKNITVEKVAKKVKGGGAKKKKAKESEEPRDSFFRSIFRNLKLGDDIPEDINAEEMMDEIEDEDEFVKEYLDNQMEIVKMIKDFLIPHAVRVFTGEAFPEDDDDDDEDGEEEDDEDDSDEESSEAPKKKGGGKKKADDSEDESSEAPKKKGASKKKGDKPEAKEECRQQ